MPLNIVQEANVMTANDEAKESIIQAAIGLIEISDGNIRSITARSIADKSGVSLGLINYHFGSKDNLIAICCSRIINKTLMSMSPENIDYSKDDGLNDKERLTFFAQQTFEFIFKNYSTVKISILADLQDYSPDCNSALTQKGFLLALRGDMPESQKKHIAFSLASIMQAAFLAGDNAKEITGYDLKTSKQREKFIADTVEMLFEGVYEK